MHMETCVMVHQQENGRKGKVDGKGFRGAEEEKEAAKQGTGCSRMREPA